MERLLRLVQPAAHVLAADVFGDLDAELVPRVALLGLPGPASPDASVLVLGAGEGLDATALTEVWQRRSRRVAAEAGEAADDMLRGAVMERVEAQDAEATSRGRDVITFGSALARVGADRALVLLRMEKGQYASYHALARQNLGAGGLPLAGSLLDAAVHEFLGAVSSGLATFRPGVGPPTLPRSHDEILRSAARVMMHGPAWAAGNVAAAPGLFLALDRLSSMRYEGGEGRGGLFLAPRGHPNLETSLTFHSAVALADHRGVRKVLELTGEGLGLLSDADVVYGLGGVTGDYERARENLFEVRFQGHASWELSHADAVLMRVVNGLPRLPRADLDEDHFRDDLARTFGHVDAARFDRLWGIALAAIRQHRGTTVVISAKAREEAVRLGNQALRITPVGLAPQAVPLFTAIDGAVLVDLDGVCTAIGVILDGRASRGGDPARGARFNSAVRYVEGADHACLAMVISEEGTVDVILPRERAPAAPHTPQHPNPAAGASGQSA
jgi:hypothetical protein